MTTDILATLNAERYGANQWWTRKPPQPKRDDELTGRRRLAECVAEAERHERPAKEAG